MARLFVMSRSRCSISTGQCTKQKVCRTSQYMATKKNHGLRHQTLLDQRRRCQCLHSPRQIDQCRFTRTCMIPDRAILDHDRARLSTRKLRDNKNRDHNQRRQIIENQARLQRWRLHTAREHQLLKRATAVMRHPGPPPQTE